MYLLSPFKKYRKELASLYERIEKIEKEDNAQVLPGSEIDNLINQINALIEGEYSKEIFDYYSKTEPVLIRIRTGEEISWKDAFGNSFQDVSKSLRHSLVGLVEGGGKYRIK